MMADHAHGNGPRDVCTADWAGKVCNRKTDFAQNWRRPCPLSALRCHREPYPLWAERFGYPMEYDGRIRKYLVHRMIFWNTANNCLILTFGVCVALLIRIHLIKTNPYEQPFSMKQIIKNLGAALFTLDIFILCVFLSRLLKMLISNDL